MKMKLTFWKLVFFALMAVGFCGTAVRFTQGLGRSTNLNDQFPWGIWIGSTGHTWLVVPPMCNNS